MPASRTSNLEAVLCNARARLHGTSHVPDQLDAQPSLSSRMQQTLNELYALLNTALTDPQAPTPSALLIGAPGSGKTLLTNRVLHLLDDLQPLTVHFSGLLHATPLAAWRHLAHELSRHDTSTAATASANNIQDCLGVISKQLQRLRDASRPFIIILHEFDRFVSATAAGMSQNVLYSLFNFMQDRTLRSACIATTAHIDVTDALEKRVKSRFAHRELILPLAETTDEVLQFVRAALLPIASPADEDADAALKRPEMFDRVMGGVLDAQRCRMAVRKFMYRTRVIAPVLRAFDAAIVAAFDAPMKTTGQMNAAWVQRRVDAACLAVEESLRVDDTSRRMITGLSVLEIALLVSLRKLEALAAEHEGVGRPVFGDVFRQYQTLEKGDHGLLASNDGERTMAKGVAEKAWEKLVECGLVCRSGHGPKDMREVQLAVAGPLVDEALMNHPHMSTAMKSWGR